MTSKDIETQLQNINDQVGDVRAIVHDLDCQLAHLRKQLGNLQWQTERDVSDLRNAIDAVDRRLSSVASGV